MICALHTDVLILTENVTTIYQNKIIEETPPIKKSKMKWLNAISVEKWVSAVNK